MVKLNLHALYSGLTMVHTLIVLCVCVCVNSTVEFVRRVTVDRYFFCLLRPVCTEWAKSN